MKNFFHSELSNPSKGFKENLESGVKHCLEIAYDYADYLYDRRFEDLKQNGTQTSGDQERPKVQELYRHLNDTKNGYQSYRENDEGANDANSAVELDILYHLAIGNICMRIGQWHLDNYHYELAEQWHGTATGALWQGMNKVQVFNGLLKAEIALTYELLLMLNIGKCSRNFAMQNRRSDFLIAKDKFQQIQTRIEDHLKSGGEMTRALALIGADASINIARIHRHVYEIVPARKEFFCILAAFSGHTGAEISICETDKGISVNVSSYGVILAGVNDSMAKGDDNACSLETIQKIFGAIGKDDQKAIILQVLIELGLLLRKERKYIDAVKTSIAVDFYDRSDVGFHDPKHNIDAINNISSAFRKLLTTSDASSESVEALINDIQSFVFPTDAAQEKVSLINQLKTYALQGNLYAFREFIRWYCDCIGPKHRKIGDWAEQVGIHLQDALNCLGSGLDEIVKSYGGAAEPHKGDYSISEAIESITYVIKANLKVSKSYSTTKNLENVQLLYLKGCVQLRFHYYDEAIETFKEVCSRREADYIRRGTLGLKGRYQLAQCYMSKAEFKKALEILQEIRDTLQSSLKSRHESSFSYAETSDAAPDFRVDRDCGYCLMQLGSYQEACSIYQKIDSDKKYLGYEHQQQIMSLNNYASCLIHTGDITTAKEILDKISELNNTQDKMTNLLWGYYWICRDKDKNRDKNENKDKKVEAQKYFNLAYGQKYDLNTDYYRDAMLYAQPDKAEEQNIVEWRSAYIINLTKIWKDSKDEGCTNKIVSFLEDISPSCDLSLNATIALAEWLCTCEDSLDSPLSPKMIDRLYRSFASISVYPEHGSRAFREFKRNSNFRCFQSDERGRILARLFVMYRYIKMIKEKQCCSQNDSSQEGTPPLHLVHYTDLTTLKLLLSEKAPGTTSPPSFRVSNCGYMNDVFEGSVFLDKMRDKVVSNAELGLELRSWNNMVRKYFPHLVRSEENMIPVGRNVYIASLSFKPDSFPLWSIYAKNETGCNIEFSKDFFDVFEESKNPEELRDYLISKYTDDDYPVYRIKYLSGKDLESELAFDYGSELQHDSDSADVLKSIYDEWKNVDIEVEALQEKYRGGAGKIEDDMLKSGINAIYTFTADRINEVRFLFKDADYQYEEEARVVVTTSTGAKIDEAMTPPRAYAIVNRTINDISVRLGSKIDDATVDQLVTWLNLTGKVREVKLSKRNRRTIDRNDKCESAESLFEIF